MPGEITTEQIKAARMLLGWDQVELATQAQLGVATIRRIEAQTGVAAGSPASVEKIVRAFTAAGISFIAPDATGGIGVRRSI
jgi:transcriptional regulator with XRE-family HTH domain